MGLALIAGCAGLYGWLMIPAPQALELRDRIPQAPRVIRTQLAQAPPDGLERCPVEVRVTSLGVPLSGAQVQTSLRVEGVSYYLPSCTTGAGGRCVYDEAPCGRAYASAMADGYSGSDGVIEDTREVGELALALVPGVLLDGRASDSDGAPLEGVRVRFEGLGVETNVAGDYALWVAPGATGDVRAHKEGYIGDQRAVHMPAEGGVTLDFVLSRVHRVTVYCAGLPGDSCAEIKSGVLCTPTALFFAQSCGGEPTVCVCPAGPAAIRGGGEFVRVEADQDVAWLDLRYDGGVEGYVTLDGEPVDDCKIELARVPLGLVEDLPRGILTALSGRCESDGHFLMEGLRPGIWRFSAMQDGLETVLPEVRIEGALVELGAVELSAGGAIAGRLVDGLTGESLSGEPVAVTLATDGVLSMPVSGDMTEDGRFEVTGLPPGDYLVFSKYDLADPTEVHLVGDDEVWVELETWAVDTPEEQGFSLVNGGTGELVIDQVTEGGGAEVGGLEAGDVLTGVSIFGFDLNALSPGASEAALRYYPGPGLSLAIERDGKSIEIALE